MPVLIGLSNCQNDIGILPHYTLRSVVHQLKSANVVRLCEIMDVGESSPRIRNLKKIPYGLQSHR